MSLVQDLQSVLLGRPRVLQKTGSRCVVCGKNIPKGRRYTCRLKCKVVVDKKAKTVYVKAQRRHMYFQKLEKAKRLAPEAMTLLFDEEL